MIKIFLATLISVFIIISATVVLFWRDDQYEPKIQDFILYFGILPLVVSFILLSPYLIVKWYKYRQDKKLQQKNSEDEQPIQINESKEKQNAEYVQLNVFSTSLKSALGENSEIIDKVFESHAPSLDMKLSNNYGNPILSYRIQEIDDLMSDNDDEYQSSIQSRIQLLIQQQFDENTEILYKIIDHLKQSALFYDSKLAYEYRMHPGWIDPNHQENEENQVVAKQVPRLNYLNVHIILADTLLHSWDESLSSGYINDFLVGLGVINQQVKIDYHYWGNETSYHEWFNLLKQTSKIKDEISFIVAVDSEIDQDIIDNRMWVSDLYVPAEFTGSCCVASTELEVQDLEKIKTIDLIFNEIDFLNSLKTLKIDQLTQFENEIPFVMIPDDVTKPKVIKGLEQNFSTSPIQSYHYLFSKNSLGHTQHLSKIFSFMLGMQALDGIYSFVYSLDLPENQVVIKPVIDESFS